MIDLAIVREKGLQQIFVNDSPNLLAFHPISFATSHSTYSFTESIGVLYFLIKSILEGNQISKFG